MPKQRLLHVWISERDHALLSAHAEEHDEKIGHTVRRLIRQLRHGAVVLAVPGLQNPRADGAPARPAFRKARAEVTRLKGLSRAGQTAVPGRRPIGFLL